MPDLTGAPSAVVEALAKLTLSLRIVGVRSDGYHLIDAEMVTVDLADTLEFFPGDGLEVIAASAPGPGLPVPTGDDTLAASAPGFGLPVPTGDDNLVRRALAEVGRRASVRLVKRIPAGAGLGGGSADAAGVLRWAGCGDLAVAAGLGADVPFCLIGGRARVQGVGEEVGPLPFEPLAGRPYTLLTPPFGVSTAAVYRQWDALGGRPAEGPNDLEPAALAVQPRLAEWRDRLGNATGRQPVLAGSGSTWFVEGAHPGAGRTVVHVARPPQPRRA